ncbi:MAG: HepT-like ribonuclease domain-containing protein [Pseudomonadota bacterium]
MTENRLLDYLTHMHQAATDACGFVEGLGKDEFLEDKRTQQAVTMSLIIIGEAGTKVMDSHAEFAQAHAQVPWRSMRGMPTSTHARRENVSTSALRMGIPVRYNFLNATSAFGQKRSSNVSFPIFRLGCC